MRPSTRHLALKLAFPMGGDVILRTRAEWLAGIVTGLTVRPGNVAYLVSWGDGSESTHYDFELEPIEHPDDGPPAED